MSAALSINTTSFEEQLDLCDEHVDSKQPRNVYVVVFCLILITAMIANGTVLYVIYVRRLWRDVSVLMIANLAISDVMVCFAVLVPEISRWVGLWIDSTYSSIHLCRIHVVAEALFPTVTIFSLVVMSFERCRIARSKVVRTRRPVNRFSRYYVTLIAVWILSLVTSLPVVKVCHDFNDLLVFVNDTGDFMTLFLLCRFIFIYVIPLVLIALFYSIMAATLYASIAATSKCSNNSREFIRTNHAGRIAHSRRRRLAIMVLLLVAVFAIGWLPYYLFRFLFYSVDPVILCTRVVLGHLKNFRLIFFCLLSLLNPCIVFVLGANFRQHFHEVIRCSESQTFASNVRRTDTCNIVISTGLAGSGQVSSVAEL